MNVIFWFLAVVFVSWILIIFVLPILGRIFVRKISRQFQNRQENTKRKEPRPEGTVHIENASPPTTHINSEAGDYVNYEEINDNK